MTENQPDVNTPIDERIFTLVSDQPTFVFKDVRSLFPMESDKTLYRAMNKLESAGRIRFLHWNRKQKVYTCSGVSKFPVFTRGQTHFDLVALFKDAEAQHDNLGRFSALSAFDDMYTTMLRLFFVPEAETDKEFKDQYIIIHQKLTDYKRKLQTMMNDIDAVLNHASMRGDLEYFKKVFTSESGPTAQEKLAFKVWLTRVMKNRENNAQEDS